MPERKSILIIGVGSIGQRHLRCFQQTGRVRPAICEINAELRAQLARQYGVEHTYADLDAALGDRYDAAVINTPANLHVPMAVKLVEAGVHVLIEKPLSTTLAGVDQLLAAVERRGVAAAVAYVLRAHPLMQAVKQALDSGRFGRPVQLVAACGQHFPTYRPAYREIYYANRATGGGAIQDALTHLVNLGEWLIGPAARVLADAAHQVLPGVSVEDTVHLLARQRGALGSYSLNQHQAPNEFTVTVICERGTLRLELHRSRWRWMVQPDEPWHDEPIERLERDHLFIAQANAFLDTLEGKAPPLCTLAEGVRTLRVNLAALASVEQGTWQTIRGE